jgi:hypothetical protein
MAGNFHQYIPASAFLLQTTGFSVLYTWMWNNTRGSLLMPHLFHAASNTTLGVLPILPTAAYPTTRPLWLAVGLLWLMVVALVAVNGGINGTTKDTKDTKDSEESGQVGKGVE